MKPFLASAVADERTNVYRRLVTAGASQNVFLRGRLRCAVALKAGSLI
jgi:hypothetical protein